MKKLQILLLIFGVWLKTDAQNIVQYEYWYDSNYGSTTVVNNSSGSTMDLNTSLTGISGLLPGLHAVNFRAKDTDGRWSSAITEQFYATGNWNIDTYEYWFDDDYANKITNTVTGSQNYILTSNLNTSAVGYGSHSLNFRAKDSAGKWSIVFKEFFFKSIGGTQMSNAEYWIDNNYANKQPLTFTSSNIVFINQTLLTANLDDQLHTFNFRMQDQAGKWSVVTSSYFMAHNQIVGYDYWFDNDFEHKKATAITPTDLLTTEPDFDANGLSAGVHVVNFRAKSSSGKYSTTIAQNVTVYVTPVFTPIAQSCSGSVLTALPTTSTNGITGTWSPALNNLATTTYTFTPNIGEFALTTVDMTVAIGAVTTWDGISWDNGTPTSTSKAIINGNYSEAVNLEACSLDVTGTAIVTVPTGFNFNVAGKITVATTASLTFENNANLVQVDDVANDGKITSKRNSNALMLLDYSLWSSPVAGQQLQGFSPATLATRFYIYNPATDKYNATTPVANFAIGTGYLIRMPNNHPTTPTVWNGSFTGIPNNGTVSLTVTNNTYNGIGNPYPSAISADAFIDANALTEALYFWRKTNNAATTSYATYTKAGGTANAGGLSSIVPNGTIAVGQGFIAKSTGISLIFTNAMRTANNAAPFLKTKAIEKSRIWLNLAKDASPANQMMVAYMTGATAGIDAGIEGKYFNDSPIALNSIINNEEFVIQGKGLPFADSDVVPLTFKTNAAGNFTISIDHVDGLFLGNQEVVLNDKELGTSQDLKKGPYTFASAIGTFNNRFELVYKSSSALGLDEQEFSNSVLVFKQNGLIHINAGKTIMKTVRVFDLQGRLIFKQEKVNQNTTVLKDFTAAEQTLLVQITSDEDKIITKKVMY